MEIAWMQIVQMDPCRALDRRGRVVAHSSSRIAGSRRSCLRHEVADRVVDVREGEFVVGEGVVTEGSVRGRDRDQIRLADHLLPYRLGHRTPVRVAHNDSES